MIFTDFKPPSSPTLSEQRDALQKGLGRTVQWANASLLDEALLLEACLHDQRYDPQFEDTRAGWLWQLIRQIEAKDHFREPILYALQNETDGWNASQLCEFAFYYAEAGDETFRNTIYHFVEQKPFEENVSLGEKEIIRLDGEQGFLFAARVRGERLETTEWDWDDEYFVSNAMEQCGKEQITRLFQMTTHTNIKRFHEHWNKCQKEQSSCKNKGSFIERMHAFSADNIIEAAQNNDDNFSFSGWGRQADTASLNKILETVWQTTELSVLRNLIRVFFKQTLPKFDCRLIDLCQHPDEKLQRRSFSVLANHSHPAVREFALEQLAIEATDNIVSLFINNYEVGDEIRLLKAIELPEDPDNIHSLLSDVMKVLEYNTEADATRLAHIAYAATPCELCRYKAANLLHGQGVAPAWMLEECGYDSYEETRKLA
ncbi:MAG: hypothetical protein QM501_02950 [Gimesia sp.]